MPAEDGSVKLALWKRIDIIQDVLTKNDRAEAESIGLITAAEYEDHVGRGDVG